jgi:hypothetical protein
MSISFVGVFGWMSIVIARPLYYLYFILYGIGLITAASRLFTKNIIRQTRKKYDYILALMLFLGISSVVRFNMYEDAYQGRYLLNIISTFVILAAEGYLFIYICFKGHYYKIFKFNFNPNDRVKTVVLSVIIFILFLMNIIIINIYIKPAYTGIYI